MKKLLIAYYGDSPVCVEGFPKDCARSCVGSIHVLPRKPVTVTEAEYGHIKAKYQFMLPKLKIVAEKVETKKVEGAEAKAEEASPSASPKPTGKKKKKPSAKGGKKSKKKKKKQ